jgi:hypothetical protein
VGAISHKNSADVSTMSLDLLEQIPMSLNAIVTREHDRKSDLSDLRT